MHICILTIGSRGDIQPCIALAVGLQKAGHQVRIGTHAEFEAAIRAQGLDFYPVKGNPRELLQSAGGQEILNSGANPISFLKKFKAAAYESMLGGFDDCLEAARGADLIIYSFFVMGIGFQIGEKLKIPSLLAYLQPYTPTTHFPMLMLPNLFLGGFLNRLSHQMAEQIFWQTFKDVVSDWRKNSLQLPPLPFWGPFQMLNSPRYPILCGFSRHLLARPSDWPAWVHITGFWFLEQAASWEPPPELTAFLEAGSAPVYVGFGSMTTSNPAATAELVIQALQDTGQRGVLMQGWGGLNTELKNEQLFLLESAPHDWLFPKMSAVVHHAGAGTTAAGLRAGIPTVSVPFFGDQPFWAWRIFGNGAGPRPIPQQKLTRVKLAQAIDKAVNSTQMRERAQDLGRKIQAERGVDKAVQIFEGLFR
jgi:sterol 3beta-glucosyltransferase